jgi:hypothetical protein
LPRRRIGAECTHRRRTPKTVRGITVRGVY